MISAIPVLADEPPVRPTGEVALAPQSLQADAASLPDGSDIEAGLAKLSKEEEAREEELEGAQAAREREQSQDAFADVTAMEARHLLPAFFGEYLERLDSDPARSISVAESALVAGGSSAVVKEDGDATLLEAGMPLKVEDESGEVGQVDLSLKAIEDGFETANALTVVQVGQSAADPIQVGDGGISIEQVGADGGSSSQPFGELNVFNYESLTDTDTLVSPTAAGVEISNVLRSEDSPDTLRFKVNLPAGAELRPDDRGGAIVVQGESELAEIPSPDGVDAQGTEVPVALAVEGDTIAVEVADTSEYAMPILVDPELVLEDWVNSYSSWQNGHNLPALENGSWQWSSEPYGLIYFGTGNPCFYTCWGRGLYLTAPSRNYGANTYSAWSYSAPNATSFIRKAWLIPFWRDDHGCSRNIYQQPHDYDGFWSGNWNALQTNEAAAVGSIALESEGQAFIVGLSSGGGINIPCWRDLYVGGAAIWLDDRDQPVLTTTSSSQWMDSTAVRLNVQASDNGLGVRKFTAEAINKTGSMQTWETWHGCTGTYTSRCPQTWNLNSTSQPQLGYDPAALPEGIRTLYVTAYDAVLRKSNVTKEMTVRIDHAAPSLKVTGTVTEQATLGTERPSYTVRAEASDGVPGSSDQTLARSGTINISEWVDGKKIHEYAPGCGTQSCSWFDEGKLEAAAYTPGQHALVVKSEDALHHVAESAPLSFKLGDQQAPAVTTSGLPAEGTVMPRRASYWSTFGTSGTGNGQLSAPADVAIDANGDVWVADKGNNRVEKFGPDGTFVSKFGSAGTGNGQFSSPAALAIDAKGNILVADKGNGRVQKFNSKGEYLSQFGTKGIGNGQFTSGGPEGLTVDAKGNIWVSDTYGGRVEKFDENGVFLKVVGSKGTAPGQLGEPTGIDVGPDGKVWVADWQNNRVAVFNEAGEFVTQFGSAGTGNGQFARPDAIAVGSRGDVWVGDQNNGRVQEFDQNGTYVGQFGSKGSGAGQFSFTYPFGVTTDSKGTIWVSDPVNNRVQRWLAPNVTANGYLEPVTASATDAGFGVTSVLVKLTSQTGVSETLAQASQSCPNSACPLSVQTGEIDLAEKPSGPYLLTVVATDGAGNRRTSSRVLNIDSTPPEVSLFGPLAESAGQPLSGTAQLEIEASDADPVNAGIARLNVQRDGQLVASYPSNCSSDCRKVEASYSFSPASDGADRSTESVGTAGNGSVGELRRLSCVAANDCWAVGRTKYTFAEQVEQGKVAEPLLEHWNGSEWQAMTVPKPIGATTVTFEGISCASATACVAVGTYSNGTSQPLVEYWDGSKWTAAAGPLPSGANKAIVYSVSCAVAGDCWAYGITQVTKTESNEGKTAVAYFAHLTGGAWQTTTMPKPEGATSASIEAVSCAAPSACMAVGTYSNGTSHPLAEQWDGSKWTPMSPPLPAGAAKGLLYGVSCGSAADCWAYGKTQVSIAEQVEGKAAVTFLERWHGGEWQVVAAPAVPEGSSVNVNGISCAGEVACTAVGSFSNANAESQALIYTRDATGWRYQPAPAHTESSTASLLGVSCTDSTQCGMVGYWRIGSGQWKVLAAAEAAADTSHQITVEAVDLQGNTSQRTIEVSVDDSSAAAPGCETESAAVASKGVVTPSQAVSAIEAGLPAAVAPSVATTQVETELPIDPTYSQPSPNLESQGSLAESETSVAPEGGFTLDRSACVAPAELTSAATEATVVNGDTAVFANTAPETDTVVRPTAMGAAVVQSLRGPNAPDSFAWKVTVVPGEELIELPSGAVALVDATSEPAEEETLTPDPPEKSAQALANAAAQLENGEYQLMKAATETEHEVIAVFAQPWVVLAQGGIEPALIEVKPDGEIENEFEVIVSVPPQVEGEPEFIADPIAMASSLNGYCRPSTSPCGNFDYNRAANYARYWGNEAHQGGWNWDHYPDYGANNCTNFLSQVLRAGRMKFMRAFDHGDGSWWYENLQPNGQLYWNEHDQTQSWVAANILPRHLWRFGLAHIDQFQPWTWTTGNMIAYDWYSEGGVGNFDHLNFVVGRYDPPDGPYEPVIANSSSPGHRYGAKRWLRVKESIEEAHGNEWNRVPLAVKHTEANLNEKKHAPENLYGPTGIFQG